MRATSSVWTGNWQAKTVARLNSRGYESFLDCMKRNPGKCYSAIAEELGPDVVAMQIVRMEFEEAFLKGELRWASMDCLVRELHEIFPNGWARVHRPVYRSLLTEEQQKERAKQTDAERIEFQKVNVLSSWVAMVDQVPTTAKPRLRAVWAALQQLCPPLGWLPQGPEDPLVVAAFEKGWPVSDKIETVPVGPHVLCPKCGAVMPQPAEEELDQICTQCGTEFPL